MNTFRVRGASRSTGNDAELIVTAANASAAEQAASRKGLLVSDVSEIGSSSVNGASDSETPTEARNSDVVLAFVSAIVPLVGLILGAVFVLRDRSIDKRTGTVCFSASIAGMLITASILAYVLFNVSKPSKLAAATPMAAPAPDLSSVEDPPAKSDAPFTLPRLRRMTASPEIPAMPVHSRFVRKADAWGEAGSVSGWAHHVRLRDGKLAQSLWDPSGWSYMEFRVLIKNDSGGPVAVYPEVSKLQLVGDVSLPVWGGERSRLTGSNLDAPRIIELNGRDVSERNLDSVLLPAGDYCVVGVCFLMQDGPLAIDEALGYCDKLLVGASVAGGITLRLDF